MEINDSTRSALIRKGNELFNNKDIDGAYRCYITASYFGGIEKIADYYNFEKKNVIKAMQLYKFILKEDSNLGGNVRAKQKLDILAQSVVKVLRKWLKEDESYNNSKNKNNANNNEDKILKENKDKILESYFDKKPNIKKAVFKKIDSADNDNIKLFNK